MNQFVDGHHEIVTTIKRRTNVEGCQDLIDKLLEIKLKRTMFIDQEQVPFIQPTTN